MVWWGEGVSGLKLRLRPSWDWVGEELAPIGVAAPETWADADGLGFVQRLPEDLPLAVAVQREGNALGIGTAICETAGETARELARPGVIDQQETAAWWKAYWLTVPRIRLPDAELMEMFFYGLYLQACATPPQGIACTLQGPFLEEVQIPPWSCDYHFNINIEMIYTPALATNRAQHLQPLWELLRSWMPILRESGSKFFGDPEALMLPHAVDDRCGVVGSFWTGCIDHGCTAWMALLCWDTVRYTGDMALLEDLAWPLLRGAFAGYWAMMETRTDGRLSFPVSVSPEFKGSRMDAWGRDASFQLAAAHAVVRALVGAAAMLEVPVDPRWEQVRRALPAYCEGQGAASVESPEKAVSRIFLWEDQDLDASHRHHSHLAGLTPFKTLDAQTADPVVRQSLHHLVYRGCGAWSGWCVPWAASLHAHAGQADAAVHWLQVWRRLFTNAGRGSLHDGAFPGVTTLAGGNGYLGEGQEIMQLDGRFGALTAVLDLLVQEYDGEIRPVPQLPTGWDALSFAGIHAPGGFVLDVEVKDRKMIHLQVESLRGERLRLRLPDGTRIDRETYAGEVLSFGKAS